MRYAVTAWFWPASKRIARKEKIRKNVLKSRSNTLKGYTYFRFVENSRFLPLNAGKSSMIFDEISLQGVCLLANQNEAF